MKKALAVLASVLMLAGCDAVRSGTVIEKVYNKPYTDTWTSKYPAYHAESFEICVKNAKGDRGCIDVPHDEYNKYKVGDHYPS